MLEATTDFPYRGNLEHSPGGDAVAARSCQFAKSEWFAYASHESGWKDM